MLTLKIGVKATSTPNSIKYQGVGISHAVCMHAVCLGTDAYGISPYSHFVRKQLDDDSS